MEQVSRTINIQYSCHAIVKAQKCLNFKYQLLMSLVSMFSVLVYGETNVKMIFNGQHSGYNKQIKLNGLMFYVYFHPVLREIIIIV